MLGRVLLTTVMFASVASAQVAGHDDPNVYKLENPLLASFRVDGKYDVLTIRRTLAKSRAKFAACFEAEQKKHASAELEKRIDVAFTIDAAGKPQEPTFASLGNPAVEQCLAAHYAAITFAKPSGGAVRVTHAMKWHKPTK